MIALTKLNNQSIVINAELIKYVEKTPDTMITMTTGERIMVRETLDEVVDRAIEYGRRVRCFAPAAGDADSGEGGREDRR